MYKKVAYPKYVYLYSEQKNHCTYTCIEYYLCTYNNIPRLKIYNNNKIIIGFIAHHSTHTNE